MKITIEDQPKKSEEKKYPVLLEKFHEGRNITLYMLQVDEKRAVTLPDFEEINFVGSAELPTGWKVSDKRIIISNE